MMKERPRKKKVHSRQPIENRPNRDKKRSHKQKISRDDARSNRSYKEERKRALQEYPPKPIRRKKTKRKRLTKEQFEKRKKMHRKKMILEIIKFTFPIVIVAVCVFFFVLKTSPHRVDGVSMLPTLKNKDHVIINKNNKPQRYEIITFKPPVKSDYNYVKRVIGMPGDRVWFVGNNLFINQKMKGEPEKTMDNLQEIPDGSIKLVVGDGVVLQMKDMKKIPKGFYFVLGDNRTNSSDSREFGLVDQCSIEGIVSFRIVPIKSFGWIK